MSDFDSSSSVESTDEDDDSVIRPDASAGGKVMRIPDDKDSSTTSSSSTASSSSSDDSSTSSSSTSVSAMEVDNLPVTDVYYSGEKKKKRKEKSSPPERIRLVDKNVVSKKNKIPSKKRPRPSSVEVVSSHRMDTSVKRSLKAKEDLVVAEVVSAKPKKEPKMRIKLSLRMPSVAAPTPAVEKKEHHPKAKPKKEEATIPKITVKPAEYETKNISRPTPHVSSSHALFQRPVKMAPIASPGLLILNNTNSGNSGSSANRNTSTITPSSVFDNAMQAAGYSIDQRTQFPHRGSSIRREVGDMFDSNVMLTNKFPSLVPDWIKNDSYGDIVQVFTSTMEQVMQSKNIKSKALRFQDMLPKSLTVKLPRSYVEKRIKYAKLIKLREKTIVEYQVQVAKEADAKLAYEDAKDEWLSNPKENLKQPIPPPTPISETIVIPPIPKIPTPPPEEDHLPKLDSKELFVSHLNPQCFTFHGRYRGLMTNHIADPQFVGPNAPGLSGSSSVSNLQQGLATSYPSTSGSSTNYSSQTQTNSHASSSKSNTEHKSNKKPSTTENPSDQTSTSSLPPHAQSSRTAITTGTSSQLKKIMEAGGDLAEKMRISLLNAAISACDNQESSSGSGGAIPWVGYNGETYPDVSKAFAVHGGLRPCKRCKSNKQGAYHCRLRRKHKELDYDGGNSFVILERLMGKGGRKSEEKNL